MNTGNKPEGGLEYPPPSIRGGQTPVDTQAEQHPSLSTEQVRRIGFVVARERASRPTTAAFACQSAFMLR